MLCCEKVSTEHAFVRRVYCCCGRLQSAHVLCSSWECTGAFTLHRLVVITSQLSICICEHFHVSPVPCPLNYRGRASKRCYFLCVYSNVMMQVGRASLLRRRRTTYNLCRQTRDYTLFFGIRCICPDRVKDQSHGLPKHQGLLKSDRPFKRCP